MKRALFSAAGLVLAAVLLIAVNVLAGVTLRSARIDLTADRLYTLSAGTKSILKSIAEPITLRFYFSEKASAQVPQIRTYANRVRELLEEYAAQSNGKVRLEVIDPEPFTDAEDRAVQAGLQGAPIDNAGTSILYFGLVGTNSTDDVQTIVFFQQEKEPFLEYDMTRLVYNLSYPKKPVVGVISGLPQVHAGPAGMARFTGQPDPWAIMEQLQAVFTVKMLEPKMTKVDADIRLLLIVHPKGVSDDALYAIDQFILGGGKAVVLVDPHSEASNMQQPQNPMMMMPQMRETSSELPKLFDAWGIDFDKSKVVGDRFLALRVNTGRGGRRQVVDFPAWLGMNKENLASGDVITNDVSRLIFASPGSLKQKQGAATSFTPLAWSTEETQLIEADTMKFMDPETLLKEFKSGGGRQVIAARVSGPVKTAFADGPPKSPPPERKEGEDKPAEEAKKEIPTPHLAESKGPVNLVVVADTDFIDDRFWLSVQDFFGQRLAVPTAGNGDFLVNAVDNLAGSSDLIGLRSRGKSQRPFTVVERLRREAEVKFLAQEKELQKKLEEAEKKIAELRKAAPSGGATALVSDEQKQALEQFRAEVLDTRKQLRDVQRNLRRDIELLATELKFANIGLVPIILVVVALVVAAARRRRRAVRAA
jgi:ABC-type uncharacterized transport system involved in gliding motility auxiliary subunit